MKDNISKSIELILFSILLSFTFLFISNDSIARSLESRPGVDYDILNDRNDANGIGMPFYHASPFLNDSNENTEKLPDLGGEDIKTPIDDIYKDNDSETLSNKGLPEFQRFWSIMSADDRKGAGLSSIGSVAQGVANNTVRDWMGQKANFQLEFNTSGQGAISTLLPVWDQDNHLLFSQVSSRLTGERTIYNLGLGYRHWIGNSVMAGINGFFDYDQTGNNSRAGVGTELWVDFLKFSANGYFRLTDWKQSPLNEMENYDERPANGYDLRINTWLPNYPKIGGEIRWEKYYGSNVVVDSNTSSDAFRNSPEVLTGSINYTPIPLVSFNAGQRGGSVSEQFAGINVTYRFGVPWSDQIDGNTVPLLRSLSGSRYDFVERNNNIVMEYKKQNIISLMLSSEGGREAGTIITIKALVTTKYGLKDVNWNVSSIVAAGGKVISKSSSEMQVLLPPYRSGHNSYVIKANAVDIRGNVSTDASINIEVARSSTDIVMEVKQPNEIIADGNSQGTAVITVKNKDGEPINNMSVNIIITDNGSCILNRKNNCTDTIKTSKDGTATILVSSLKLGTSTITATLDNGNSASGRLVFIADTSSARIDSFIATPSSGILANGINNSVLRTAVVDQYGNPVEGITVRFSTDSNSQLSSGTMVTDKNGVTEIRVTSLKSGTFEFIAMVNNQSKKVSVGFVGDEKNAEVTLTADKTTLVASGNNLSTLTALVRDMNGNSIANSEVSFITDGTLKLSSLSGMTNDNGVLTITAGGNITGVYTVKVVHKKSGKTAEVKLSLVADSSTAKVSSLVATPTKGIPADSITPSTITATVTDSNGNPVRDTLVYFGEPQDSLTFSSVSAITDENGHAVISITGTLSGTFLIKATTDLDNIGKTVSLEFVGDLRAAKVFELFAAPEYDIASDGKSVTTLTAIVRDTHGNLLKGVAVEFSGDPTLKFSTYNATTDENGRAIVSVSSLKAGVYAIKAITGSDSSGKTVNVEFVSDPNTAQIIDLMVSPDTSLPANGDAKFNIVALVKDANGNLLKGVTVNFNSDVAATLSSASVVTDSEGKASISVSSVLSGTYHIDAILPATGSKKSASVLFTAAIVDVDNTIFTVDRNIIPSDNISLIKLTFHPKDKSGNAITGAKITFVVSKLSGVSIGAVSESNGVYTATLKADSIGLGSVSAEIDGKTVTNLKAIEFGVYNKQLSIKVN